MLTPGPTIPLADSAAESSRPSARPFPSDRSDDPQSAWIACALDRLAEGVLVTDAVVNPSGPHIIYVNDAICHLTGYEREELIGRNPRIFQGAETDPNETARLREEIRAGREYRGELRQYRRDGSSFLAACVVTPIVDEHGTVTHFVALERDLTNERRAAEALRHANDNLEHRVAERTSALADLAVRLQREIDQRARSEEALRLSEQRFRQLGDCSPMGIFLTDATGECRYSNPRLQAITGASDVELFGEGYANCIHREDRGTVTRQWRQHAGEGLKGAITFRVVRPSGEIRWVQTRTAPMHSQSGALLGHVGSVQDITDQRRAEEGLKQAHSELEQRVEQRTRELSLANEWLAAEVRERRQIEQALRESEARWRALVENAPAYILLTDVDGTIRFINRARVGLTTELLTGASLYDHVHPETLGLFTERLRECVASGEPTEFEATGYDAEGGILWYHTRVAPIKRGNSVTGLLFVSTDITDRRQAEEQARVRQAELAHMARINTATELASGLAHEINQPLTAIASSAEAVLRFLRNGEPLNRPDTVQTIEHIAGQARRAADVVRHLRGFVRKAPPSRASEDINTLVEDTVAFMSHEARRGQVRIETDLAEGLPALVVDPVQIQQVLVNLIKNACEALGDTPANDRRIVVRTRRADESSVVLSVEDCGAGIDAAVADQIFNTFFTTKSTGLGLGLSISRSLVEDHGGQMWMTPNAVRGVTFHCRLPFLGANNDHARALRFLD